MRSNRFFSLLVLVVLLIASIPSVVQAQTPPGEGEGAPSPASAELEGENEVLANDYLWIPAASFIPRNTNTSYQLLNDGCLASLSGGSGLQESFTVPLHLPQGSMIRGLRHYYYNTSTGSSRLSLTSYDGMGNFTDHVFVDSATAANYNSVYTSLTTPFQVDNFTSAFVLNWYPAVAGPTMRLCGARVFYDKGTAADNYRFYAGTTFFPRESGTKTAYGNTGCTFVSSGYSPLVTDLDLPSGSTIQGVRYYFLNATNDGGILTLYMTSYDGQGLITDHITGYSTTAVGYNSVYLSGTYTVDQYSRSLSGIVDGTNLNHQFCGMRVFYDPPAISAEPLPAEEAPVIDAAAPDENVSEQDLNVAESEYLVSGVVIPQGATVTGVRLFYYALYNPKGLLYTYGANGTAAPNVGTVTASLDGGYNSDYASYLTPYTVDHFNGSLYLAPNLKLNHRYYLCGARVFYESDGISQYRFIAGSNFHPASSTASYHYVGTGCVVQAFRSVYLPLVNKP